MLEGSGVRRSGVGLSAGDWYARCSFFGVPYIRLDLELSLELNTRTAEPLASAVAPGTGEKIYRQFRGLSQAQPGYETG